MLYSILQEAARAGASRTALVSGRGRWTYGRLANAATQLAAALQQAGVHAGSHVDVVSNEPAESAVAFFAAAARGAIVRMATEWNDSADHATADLVLLSTHYSNSHHGICSDSKPPALTILGHHSHDHRASAARLRQTGPVIRGSDDPGRCDTFRSQNNIVHEAAALVRAVELQLDDRILCTMPLDDRLGLTVALVPAVAAQATMQFWSPDCGIPLWDAVERSRPTILVSDLDTLAAQFAHRRDVNSPLRAVRLIVAPRSELLAAVLEAQAGFSGKLATFYHRAATGVVTLNRHGGTADCVGRPLPGVRVLLEQTSDMPNRLDTSRRNFGSFVCLRSTPRILLDETRQVCEPGVPGRIVIESPAAAHRATLNGRHYTNELGYFDADGDLHLLQPAGPTAVPYARSA